MKRKAGGVCPTPGEGTQGGDGVSGGRGRPPAATTKSAGAKRRCGGCLLLSPGTRITRLSPFAWAETSTTRLAVQGTAGPFAINFSRPFRCRFIGPKKISRSPPDICTGPCSFTPLRRTALKRVKVISRGRFSRSPDKVKTAAPATQRVMVKN